MSAQLVCWKCGTSLAELPLPLSRRAECSGCRTDLHVCRLCEFYEPRVSNSCREPIAEEVKDKERANFCGYFRARVGAYGKGEDSGAGKARDQLEALFGMESARRGDNGSSEADRARAELNRLFGVNDGEDS
jgi:hypothetical protein